MDEAIIDILTGNGKTLDQQLDKYKMSKRKCCEPLPDNT